ncbi:hypothetical protein BDP27DRAFT_28250 [Rhodocollybia butyracea]|uniref:Uncharacterized protein n=1 Tax=Rhodocollybia butyracea TaxID=206335 RepID=A0A9P5UGT5_9AGAR|nr:hypothetical protein BDP27DRAFT_28250 [Rhodocollybia butyracea]
MEDLLDVQKLVIQLNSARRKIGELEAKIEALDSQKNEESQWLWCHRRLDEIEAQIAILKSKRRDMSPESLTEESALTRAEKAEDHLLILKAENRALIREITALQKKCGLEDARQTLPGSNLSRCIHPNPITFV